MPWLTEIFLKPNVDRAIIREKCDGIQKVDKTFVWKIEDEYLIIESPTYPQAKARGMKLVKQYLKEYDLGFEVKKK